MQELQAAGVPVHTVGKIGQVFDGVGVDHAAQGRRRTPRRWRPRRELIDTLDGGFVFTNLVETDQVYGHRNDVPGYHEALQGDRRRGGRRGSPRLDPERDLLIITADHGCDPTTPGTDHTREHVPLLARFGATAVSATMVRSLTSARRCCSGSPAATRRFRARRSSKPPNLRQTRLSRSITREPTHRAFTA